MIRTGHMRVVVALAAILPVAAAEVFAAGLLEQALQPLTRATVSAVAGVLSMGETTVYQSGAVFAHAGGFAYEIHYRCTGLWPLLLFFAGIMALGGSGRVQALSCVAGACVLLLLNVVRLVSLFWIGVHWPRLFPAVHELAWPLMWLVTIGVLWYLLGPRQAEGPDRSAGKATDSQEPQAVPG